MRELKTVAKTYEYRDESGYCFHVHVSYDPEVGWSASVTAMANGLKTDEAALDHLRHPLEHCLRLLAQAQASAKREGE